MFSMRRQIQKSFVSALNSRFQLIQLRSAAVQIPLRSLWVQHSFEKPESKGFCEIRNQFHNWRPARRDGHARVAACSGLVAKKKMMMMIWCSSSTEEEETANHTSYYNVSLEVSTTTIVIKLTVNWIKYNNTVECFNAELDLIQY